MGYELKTTMRESTGQAVSADKRWIVNVAFAYDPQNDKCDAAPQADGANNECAVLVSASTSEEACAIALRTVAGRSPTMRVAEAHRIS